MNKFIYLLIFLILTSCWNSEKKDAINNQVEINKNTIEKETDVNLADSLLTNQSDFRNVVFLSDYNKMVDLNFSNLELKDTFSISIPKGKISETKSKLTIKNAEGFIILENEFLTEALVTTYLLEDMKSYSDVLKNIKKNVDENLNSKRLTQEKDNKLLFGATKSDFLNYEAYSDSKKNKLPIYDFKLSNELHSLYVYSKKDKKAVIIFDCC